MSVSNLSSKFTGDATVVSGVPHSLSPSSAAKTDINPAGVFPTTDNVPDPDPPRMEGASIFRAIENPYALTEGLNKLESALDEIIGLFETEGKTLGSEGSFTKGKEAIALFEGWKQQLEEIKAGRV